MGPAVSDTRTEMSFLRRTSFLSVVSVLSVVSLSSMCLPNWFGGPDDVTRTLDIKKPLNATNVTIDREIVPRAFHRWPANRPLPCSPIEIDNNEYAASKNAGTNTGFLFLKPFKTGSSSSAGMHLRIARNVARRQHRADNVTCKAIFDHGPQPFPAHSMFSNRTAENTFLWTVIREPSRRVVSAFFHFFVSRRKQEPSVVNFERFLMGNGKHKYRDYYLRSLHTGKQFQREVDDPIDAVNDILESYDFIGITERLDESAIVLMLLLDIPMADILYLTAKSRGGYGGGANGKCFYIQPSFVTSGMQELLDGQDWQNDVQYDRALYDAANRSLDMTIERLGRKKFESELARFKSAKQMLQEKCVPTASFPCDSEGRLVETTDCLWKDSGCGTPCLDQVATDLGLW